MRRWAELITRFGRDESGVFAVVFGIMAIVLIAFGGAAVDYVSMEQIRNRSQIALDAAALALQPDIFNADVTAESIRKRAEDLMIERIGDDRVTATLDPVRIDVAGGSLYLSAHIETPTLFVSLVGVQTMRARIETEATRRMLDVEVAMVLDNSGSMSGSSYNSPINSLKRAACNATNILFYGTSNNTCVEIAGATRSENIRISVVPFTQVVNIGKQFVNETWLDWKGESHLAAMGYIPNFDNDDRAETPFVGPMDRRDLYSQTGTQWQGCIEARISPYDTTDDLPDATIRKFVPMFTPDSFDSNNNTIGSDSGPACRPKTCTRKSVRSCTGNKTGCNGPETISYEQSAAGVSRAVSTLAACRSSSYSQLSANTTYSSNGRTQTVTTVYNVTLTQRERQDRLCKYDGAALTNAQTNMYCPTAAVLPLTEDPKSVLDRVNVMVASGNTNIQQGAVWGMHALTPGAPLTEALDMAPGRVAKVLILMTDGENLPMLINSATHMNGSSYFSWGFRYDGRLGERLAINTSAKVIAEMDVRTKATCQYAKSQRGIEIYTIGLGSSSATRQMLTTCASSSQHAYFPSSTNELDTVFKDIAAKLSALRLSQ